MIYDYIVSPHPRRLVFTAPWLPTVTIPCDPDMFGEILALVDRPGEASALWVYQALRMGLVQLSLSPEILDSEIRDGEADA
jgi:hypothetical protein